MYRFGLQSLRRMIGVDSRLVLVAERALQLSSVDFACTEGLRSQARQDDILAAQKVDGVQRTKTAKSKHLIGQAIHLVPYQNGRPQWDTIELFDEIAEAMRMAGRDLSVRLRWGHWWFGELTATTQSAAELRANQTAVYRQRGQRPFDDSAHFELV